MDKYENLRKHNTNGANFGVETEDIIERLIDWDRKYGIDITDVESDGVAVDFKSLPDDLDSLAEEIYQFCPDMLGDDGELDEEIPDDFRKLLDGVNFEDEDYGMELLKRSLKQEKAVSLWWD